MIPELTKYSRVFEYRFTGTLVGVNKWHGARVVRCGKSVRAAIYKTSEYTKFVDDISSGMRMEFNQRPFGKCHITILQTINTIRDVDSILKPVMDAMQHAGVVENDRDVEAVSISVTDRVKVRQSESFRLIIMEIL